MSAVIYKYDDWQGLFVDGVKVYEQHEVRLDDLKQHCPDMPVKYIEEVWVDKYSAIREHLYHDGRFPETQNDVLALMEQSDED